MLLKRHFERLLLSPADLKPLRDDFEVVGVFNPGAIVAGGEVILLVRVAERPRERRPGFTALPRWAPGEGLVIDWLADDAIEVLDPRVVKRKADGLVRLTFISHLRVVRCGDGRSVKEVSDVRFLPDIGPGGIRRRGPADHGDRRPVFLHLRRGLAPWRGDRAGLDDRFPPLRSARDDLLPREQGRGLVPGANRWPVRRASSSQRGDAVLPPRDVGRTVARFDPLGPARVSARRRRRVGDRPRRRGHAARARRRRLARDLPRQPPADPARRGGHVCDRRVAARPDNPATSAPAHGRFDLRADGRFRAARLRAGRGVSHGDRRDGRSYLIYYGAADSCTAVVEFSK